MPRRVLSFGVLVAASCALLLAPGCATRRYVGPTTGRSADMQGATSAALDRAVRSFSFARFSGKSCVVTAVSLAENVGGESPENAALRWAFAETLARDGVRVVSETERADLRLAVRARVVGVNVVRRDFPLFYYRETTTAVVDLGATVFDPGEWKILDRQNGHARLHLAQSYWFYIVGPFESREWE